MRRGSLPVLLCAVALSLAACSEVNKEQAGGAAGAVMGVLIGSMFGDGAGRATAMAVGGIVGGLAGSAFGRDLDEADRRKAQRAAFTAANAETGDRIVWSSDEKSGVGGYAEPAGKAEIDNGNLCKTVRSVYVLDGKEKSDVSRFCFKNGRWESG